MSMSEDFNKSGSKGGKQSVFNELRGVVSELNDGEKFCSITLKVGHENYREVNLGCKKHQFDKFLESVNIGDRVSIRFFLSSRKKERWYTMANILEVTKL
jgi:hypothetical protein